MAPNIIEQFENHGPEVSDGRTEEAYWICLAFLVYDDIHKKEPSSLQDNQNLQACLDRKSTDTYKTDAYWLWHDLLDILDYWRLMTGSMILNLNRKRRRSRKPFCNLTSFAKPVGTG